MSLSNLSEEETFIKFCKIIKGKYNEEDILSSTDTEKIVRHLCDPKSRPPESVIKGITKNWKKREASNLQYHLYRIIGKLFIGGLHCDNPTDEYGFPLPEYNFKTKFLSKRLSEPLEEIMILERKLEEVQSNNHYDDMCDLKVKVKDLNTKNKELKDKNSKLEDIVLFKEQMMKGMRPISHLEAKDRKIEELERMLKIN